MTRKSLAHPEWPYVGTPWEWKGFAEKATDQLRDPKDALSAFEVIRDHFGMKHRGAE